MAVPEGYISLGFVGFTDKGEFSPDIVYAKNDVVHKDNAIWKCLVDDTVGIAPVEGGGNWEIFIQSQTKANGITVTDTFGVVGDTGEVVVAQTFLDSLADKVMNQVLKKADLVNNALATIPGQAALDSAMGKNFQNQIDGINSNLGSKFPSDSEVKTRSELPNVTLICWNNQGIHEGHFRLNISYDTFIDLTITEHALWFSKTEGGVFLENKLVASFDG